MHRSQSQDTGLRGRTSSAHQPYRPMFTSSAKVPGFATARAGHRGSVGDIEAERRQRRRSGSSPVPRHRSASRSRESSPRLNDRSREQSEEIPLEDLSRRGVAVCPSTSSLPQQQTHLTLGSGEALGSPRPESRSEDVSMEDHALEPGEPHCSAALTLLGPSHLEVPLLLPPNLDSTMLLPPAASDPGESPVEECLKPCCVSETSFSEGSAADVLTGELPLSTALDEACEVGTEGDDSFNESPLPYGGAMPKTKGAVHTV